MDTNREAEYSPLSPDAMFLQRLWLRTCSDKYPLYKPASSSDLEEDPLFGDDVSPDSRLSGSDWLSSSPPMSPDHSRCDGKTEVHKIVNRYRFQAHRLLESRVFCELNIRAMTITVEWCRSFLCLVPDEAKSSYHVEGTGYDTYLRDAHRQVRLVWPQVLRTAAWRASAESGRKITCEKQRWNMSLCSSAVVAVVSWGIFFFSHVFLLGNYNTNIQKKSQIKYKTWKHEIKNPHPATPVKWHRSMTRTSQCIVHSLSSWIGISKVLHERLPSYSKCWSLSFKTLLILSRWSVLVSSSGHILDDAVFTLFHSVRVSFFFLAITRPHKIKHCCALFSFLKYSESPGTLLN